MAVDFQRSKTKENLMKAFAGESQARNRYTIAAEMAREHHMYAVSQIFLFTAEQERAHAQRYYELLKEAEGQTIEICSGFPVDTFDSLTELLAATRQKNMKMSIRCLEIRQKKRDFWRRRLHFSRLQKWKKYMRKGSGRSKNFWKIIPILNLPKRGHGCV